MPKFSLQLVTGPTAEPLTLSVAKQHLLVDAPDQDDYITSLISVAREYVENWCNRAIFDQTWAMVLDSFPFGPNTSTVATSAINDFASYGGYFDGFAIKVPLGGVNSITSISYFDGSETQTLDSGFYAADFSGTPARILPRYGQSWPYPSVYTPGTVKVTIVAGSYGDGTDLKKCPASIKQAMLLMMGHLYENREATTPKGMIELPLAVEHLLSPYKVHAYLA